MYLYRMRYRNSLPMLILTVTTTPSSVSFGLQLCTQADMQCSLKALQAVYSPNRTTHMTNVIHSSYSFTNLQMLSSSFISCRWSGVKNDAKGSESKCMFAARKRLIGSLSSRNRKFDCRTAAQSYIELNESVQTS